MEFDVAVVGAGPTGAFAAELLAAKGLKVVLLDQKKAGKTGAQWLNGVPLWMLEEAGLGKPPQEQIFADSVPFRLISPTSRHSIKLGNPELLDVDMRQFGAMLIERAAKQPTLSLLLNTQVRDVQVDADGRPIAVTLSHGNPAKPKHRELRAKLFVDASGMAGVIREATPALKKACSPLHIDNLCLAAQATHAIKDKAGASAFLEQNRAQAGEILAWIGVHGPFSLLRVHISEHLDEVSFLTGSMPDPKIPSGLEIIRRFISNNSWVGTKHFGGARSIPLRHPYAKLVAPGAALIGDSACQVYTAHGAGIGIGLLAAKVLADAIHKAENAGLDIGSQSALSRYEIGFHKKWGALLNGAEAFRRLALRFDENQFERIMGSGLITPKLMQDALLQKPMRVYIDELSMQLSGLMRARGDATALLPLVAKMPLSRLASHIRSTELRSRITDAIMA
jgi:flavin-dependent dehydrogenase